MEIIGWCMAVLLTTAEYTLRFPTLQVAPPPQPLHFQIVPHCFYLAEACQHYFVITVAGSRLLLFQKHHTTTDIIFLCEVIILVMCVHTKESERLMHCDDIRNDSSSMCIVYMGALMAHFGVNLFLTWVICMCQKKWSCVEKKNVCVN